jgi:hypothetical protein
MMDADEIAGAKAEQGEGQEADGAEAADAAGAGAKEKEYTDEEKHDMWLDFAADRFEIVEQLPIELHRNFRLLRELDEGCGGEWS